MIINIASELINSLYFLKMILAINICTCLEFAAIENDASQEYEPPKCFPGIVHEEIH